LHAEYKTLQDELAQHLQVKKGKVESQHLSDLHPLRQPR
jgi:hypothetical protein